MMKKYINYNEGKIYYSDKGEGEAIILLHGYLETSEIWAGFADKLSGKFRVICVDLPGHGLSEVYSVNHSMEFMAGAIACLMENLHLPKAFITGHSLGGYVALAFLELYPDMLSAYCLFHSHPFADRPEVVANRKREMKVVRAAKKHLLYPGNISRMYSTVNLEKFGDDLRRSEEIAATISDEGIIAVLNGMMNRPSRLKVMEQGRVPCLWILGRHDNYISCDDIILKVSLPANSRLEILENSGHMGFIEEQDLSVELISDFVSGMGRGL